MFLVFFGCGDWFGFVLIVVTDRLMLGWLSLMAAMCFDYLIVLVSCDSLCLVDWWFSVRLDCWWVWRWYCGCIGWPLF